MTFLENVPVSMLDMETQVSLDYSIMFFKSEFLTPTSQTYSGIGLFKMCLLT